MTKAQLLAVKKGPIIVGRIFASPVRFLCETHRLYKHRFQYDQIVVRGQKQAFSRLESMLD